MQFCATSRSSRVQAGIRTGPGKSKLVQPRRYSVDTERIDWVWAFRLFEDENEDEEDEGRLYDLHAASVLV